MDPAYDRQWTVVRGDDQSRAYQITEDDGTTPVALTGTVSDAANGYVEITLTDTQTALLTEPRYAFDLVETYGTDETTVVLGTILTTARVTA